MNLPHIHTYFRDNNSARRRRPRLLDRSFHLWVRRHEDDERTLVELGGQVIAGRPDATVSARLHFGGLHSETPIDMHVSLFGQALYLNTSRGGRLAQALTKGNGRDLSMRINDGRLWYMLWADPNHHRKGDKRQGTVVVNVLDRIYGRKRFYYEDLDAAVIDLELPEGTYPVKLTLQLQRHGRPKQHRRTEQLTVQWDARHGIPTHYDSSAGWKGDRTYGSAVNIDHHRPDWHVDATAALAAWVLNERARTGFRIAQTEEQTA